VQPVGLMVRAVVDEMSCRGIKTLAYIGFSDGFGDQVYDATKAAADAAKIEVVANERYARTDTSAEAQVLRVISKKPDAVMIGGSGTPTAPEAAAPLANRTMPARGALVLETVGVEKRFGGLVAARHRAIGACR